MNMSDRKSDIAGQAKSMSLVLPILYFVYVSRCDGERKACVEIFCVLIRCRIIIVMMIILRVATMLLLTFATTTVAATAATTATTTVVAVMVIAYPG